MACLQKAPLQETIICILEEEIVWWEDIMNLVIMEMIIQEKNNSLKEQVGDTVDIVYIKCCPYLNVAMGTYSDKAQKKIIQRNKEQDLIK